METITMSQLLYPGIGLASLLFFMRAILAFFGEPKPVNWHACDPFQRKAKQEFNHNARELIAKGLEEVSLAHSRVLAEGRDKLTWFGVPRVAQCSEWRPTWECI
jgi:hypothetical protein